MMAEAAELEGFIETLQSELEAVEESMAAMGNSEISDSVELAECVLALVLVKLTLLRIRMVARQRREHIVRVTCGN